MKQLSLANILQRISLAMKGQDKDVRRLDPACVDDRDVLEERRSRRNQATIARIAFNFALLLLLAGFDPNRGHAKALEHLLIICSAVACFIALLTRERWSLSDINRWDEALIFTTVALGLRTFA